MTSRKSKYYTDVFALLWSVNHRCLPLQQEQHSNLQTNMILVSLQLDSFFHDVIGLTTAQNLPTVSLPTRVIVNNGFTADSANNNSLVKLDTLPLWYSKSYLISVTSHLEDMFDLLKQLASNKVEASGSAKKVKPRSISSGTLTDRTGSASWQQSSTRITLGSPMSPSWPSNRPGTPNNREGIKDKLIDSFFHQHQDLQQLCEMTVDRVIKNFSNTVSQTIISPMFKDGATSYEEYLESSSPMMTLDDYTRLLQSVEVDAKLKARAQMNEEFERIINGSLGLLAASESNPTILDIAASLAINHAAQKGEQIIRSIIQEEKKKHVDEFIRKERKVKAGVPLKNNARIVQVSSDVSLPNFQSLAELNMLLQEICELEGARDYSLERLKQKKKVVIDELQRYFIGCDASQSSKNFETLIASILKSFFSAPSNTTTAALRAAVEVTDVLCRLGDMGYLGSTSDELESLICKKEHLATLMKHVSDEPSGVTLDADSIGSFLYMLVDGSLLSYLSLEKVLLEIVKYDASKDVARVMLKKLAAKSGFSDWNKGFAVMVRLQKLLANV